jgi:cytochrome P450
MTPKAVAELRPIVVGIATRLLDDMARRGAVELDLMDAYIKPLPIAVIGAMLGLPRRLHADVLSWCWDLLPSFTPALSARELDRVDRAMGHLLDLFRNLVAARRRRPGDGDLIDRLLAARDAEQRLSEEELIANVIFFIFAGQLSAVQLMAGILPVLQSHPEALQQLREDPSRVDDAVEEGLRLLSPLQVVYRVTSEPLEIGGRSLPADALVVLCLAAANRDPSVFPEPDRFDLARKPRHLAFGRGLHFCVGAALARLEVGVGLGELLRRFPGLSVDSAGIRRESSVMVRGIETLPATLTPGEWKGADDNAGPDAASRRGCGQDGKEPVRAGRTGDATGNAVDETTAKPNQRQE